MPLFVKVKALLRKIAIARPRKAKKDKKKKKVETKTTEPEEAIFIGIND